MKKSFIILLITLFSLPVHAQALKVGYVNMKVLLTQAPQVEEINKKLQDRFGDPKKELDEMADSIQQLEKEIKRNELMMTESKLKKSKQNLLEKIKVYREKEAALAKELQAVQNQELAVFRNVVRDVLSEMAAKEKYDLILNDGVMYAADAINITQDLLKRLQSKASSQ